MTTHIINQYSRVENNTLVIVHNFNGPLECEHEHMSKYSSLRFEDTENHPSSFNHPILLTWNLQEVHMGQFFNNVIILNPGLRKLSFGSCFNKSVELTYNLTHITFGYMFNKTIILTPNIQYLTMETVAYKHSIILNKMLIELDVKNYGGRYVVFPKNLKRITHRCSGSHACIIPLLPKSITHVDLKNMTKPIIKLTKKLLFVKLNNYSSYEFGYKVIANKYAFSIYLDRVYCCVQFPKSLKNLTLKMYNDTFETTKNLNYLRLIGMQKTHNVTIEHSVKKLSICVNKLNFSIDNLPNSIENLETRIFTFSKYFVGYENFHIVNYPNSLKNYF